MPLSTERLREIVTELASRPRHEKVRSLVYALLADGLGASSTEIDFERQVPEVRGRVDALLGRTLFEFKSDLRREDRDVERRMPDYLSQREADTGEHFIGIATDGATFITYELRDNHLQKMAVLQTPVENPRELLAWLSSAVAIHTDLDPIPDIIRRELGRDSLAWHIASKELKKLWQEVCEQPDVHLKRELWAQLMKRVYGGSVDQDDLFFQHTYLTIIAKTMATHLLGISVTPEPADLLAGRPFQEAGISGAVESDLFDWLLASQRGSDLVHRIALQAKRFRLREVQADVLKSLYESLIDPQQRHDLGEYYTPDWLAQRMCAHSIAQPLEQRVLDPACGSGTFLFHAIKMFLTAADDAASDPVDAVRSLCQHIYGVDIHPVSVQIARVTYLLAIGEDRLRRRPSNLTIPVYLGDSLQWDTRGFLAEREVIIRVPDGEELLEFPYDVVTDPTIFDMVVGRMLSLSRENSPSEGLAAWLDRTFHLAPGAKDKLLTTYRTLCKLHRDGRDHIWGFVARNLARPVWLSQEERRMDVVIGNPPWLSYRHMERITQQRFREECQRRGLWAGGQVATHQDLSGYFFVRCVELYLKQTGTIAFVMPYAAMTRQQFEGFRSGNYGSKRGRAVTQVYATVQFSQAWALRDDVQPLFPVPSCVLFGQHGGASGPVLPPTVMAASRTLPRRDASMDEANEALTWHEIRWPTGYDDDGSFSPYRDQFRNGATIFPRVLCTVELVSDIPFGANPDAPLVESRRTSQEKSPWKNLQSLRGNIEREFLRPLYLGESVAPFRLLEPVLSVIPFEETSNRLLDADLADRAGYIELARWLTDTERLWALHGRGGMTFTQQIDYYGKLRAQFPITPLRVVYSKAGAFPAAALVYDVRGVIENRLYWLAVDDESEAKYLLAVLNSETARERTEHLQSRGQWGARDFDKVILSLPIARYDATNGLHGEVVSAAQHALEVAAAVELREGTHFVKARRLIREALKRDGVLQRIDELVAALLGNQTSGSG